MLTAATGAIDGVSYLALDRVFTGNMTGNVLFIGFGLAGEPDLPVLNNVVALLAFMLGAVLGGRFTRGTSDATLPRKSLIVLIAGCAVTLLVGAAWAIVGKPGDNTLVVITAILALVLGAQAAAVKHVGIRDLSTVVVTMTMVNLSTDSRAAGGPGTSWARRLGAILAMGVGALVAALLVRHFKDGAIALLFAGVVMVVAIGLLACVRKKELEAA
ncbi:YoaK family protein [Winogradskya consettensis]|uniref:Membrane protein n=1 Tax=Winogradskya consettensis TaxID=113560 RepID=A0A919W034_9ACTN|nr:YoaK family protein [Actinoplanes consettensis]GIM83161.1 membrane protein [Actinoplanes consettensis]